MKARLLAICLFAAVQLPAFPQANVTFAAPSGYRLTVEINGSLRTDDQYVRIEDIPAGECTARLTATNGSGQTYTTQSALSLPDRRETSYFVLVADQALQVHWTNETALATAAPDRPQVPAYGGTDRGAFEGHDWNRDTNGEDYPPSYRNGTYGGNGGNGYGYGENTYGQGRRHNQGYGRRNGPDASCRPRMLPVLSPGEVVRLQRAMRQVPFDADRMHMLANTLRRASLTAGSVRELTRSLSFDRNRLDFAKRAYASTLDQHNYHVVASAFDFTANARELQRYVMQH